MSNETDDQPPNTGWVGKAIIVVAMALAVVVAIGGAVAVYKATFIP